MKLFIAGTQKTGNVWLEKLLSRIYDIPTLDLALISDVPPAIDLPSFVTHQHYMPTPVLLEWGEDQGVRFLTLTRHPGDVFTSLYHYVNNFAEIWADSGWVGKSHAHVLIGKRIDSPEALEFLRMHFRRYVLRSLAWLQSGASLVLRFENLKAAPVETLENLTSQIRPVPLDRIREAVEACHIDKMREESELLRLHCRKGRVGSWREELSEAHVEILRESYSRELVILGYELNGGGVLPVPRGARVPLEEASRLPLPVTETESPLRKLEAQIRERDEELASGDTLLEACTRELGFRRRALERRDEELDSVKAVLQSREEERDAVQGVLRARDRELASVKAILEARETELGSIKSVLGARDEELESLKAILRARQDELAAVQVLLRVRDEELAG